MILPIIKMGLGANPRVDCFPPRGPKDSNRKPAYSESERLRGLGGILSVGSSGGGTAHHCLQLRSPDKHADRRNLLVRGAARTDPPRKILSSGEIIQLGAGRLPESFPRQAVPWGFRGEKPESG